MVRVATRRPDRRRARRVQPVLRLVLAGGALLLAAGTHGGAVAALPRPRAPPPDTEGLRALGADSRARAADPLLRGVPADPGGDMARVGEPRERGRRRTRGFAPRRLARRRRARPRRRRARPARDPPARPRLPLVHRRPQPPEPPDRPAEEARDGRARHPDAADRPTRGPDRRGCRRLGPARRRTAAG